MLYLAGILMGFVFVLLAAFSIFVHPYGVEGGTRSRWDFFVSFGYGAGAAILLLGVLATLFAMVWRRD